MRAVQGVRAALVILWLTILLTGCGSDSVAPATLLPTAPTPSPIVPMGPLVTLTGQVTDAAGAPMNATVSAYPLRMSQAWYGPWGRSAQADVSGRYRIATVPQQGDPVYVKAWRDGYVQQCAAAVIPNVDVSVDLTLIEKAQVRTDGLPSSPNTRHVSGVVYETRDNERRPVAGVWVGWEPIMDTVVADTFSDTEGRYRICGLPPERIEVFAVRIGSRQPVSRVVQSGGDSIVDLELP